MSDCSPCTLGIYTAGKHAESRRKAEPHTNVQGKEKENGGRRDGVCMCACVCVLRESWMDSVKLDRHREKEGMCVCVCVFWFTVTCPTKVKVAEAEARQVAEE